jgi:hypothetical protein
MTSVSRKHLAGRARRDSKAEATALRDRLVENALDFLNVAIEQFEEKPKHSIINFYSAVELFLKARLLYEHWSLVVTSNPDKQRFAAGDFQSVSFEDACTRLQRIVQSPLPDNARLSFDVVRKHRNKMVHFFHEGDSKKASLGDIAAEQLRAWHHLNALLSGQWRREFDNLKPKLAVIESKLSRHRQYLRVKFDELGEQIAAIQERGGRIEPCESCGFKAAEATEILDDLDLSP